MNDQSYNIWSGIWRMFGVVKNLIVAQDIMSMDPACIHMYIMSFLVFVIAALTLNIKCSISYGERFCFTLLL